MACDYCWEERINMDTVANRIHGHVVWCKACVPSHGVLEQANQHTRYVPPFLLSNMWKCHFTLAIPKFAFLYKYLFTHRKWSKVFGPQVMFAVMHALHSKQPKEGAGTQSSRSGTPARHPPLSALRYDWKRQCRSPSNHGHRWKICWFLPFRNRIHTSKVPRKRR